MRLIADDRGAVVGLVLSRRNLLALLHKLDMLTSKRTLIADGWFEVRAEDNDVHYEGRHPGDLHPETEAFVAAAG